MPVRRTAKGGATFEYTSDPLHTTPRSLFFAQGAVVLWGYFAHVKKFGGEMGSRVKAKPSAKPSCGKAKPSAMEDKGTPERYT